MRVCESHEQFNTVLTKVKLTACPHCGSVGNLIRHGYLRGYDDKHQRRKTTRAQRVFCSNRKRATGCGEYCRKIYNKLLRFRYENKNHNAWIRDISRGGAFIETNLWFPIGKKIILTIPAKKARKVVRIQGWIVRCSEAGFGIKFNRRTDSAERRFDIDRRNRPDRRQK